MDASYRNGVSDGAYNQWLPRVRKIIEADAKFPPPGYKKRPTEAEWLNDDDDNV